MVVASSSRKYLTRTVTNRHQWAILFYLLKGTLEVQLQQFQHYKTNCRLNKWPVTYLDPRLCKALSWGRSLHCWHRCNCHVPHRWHCRIMSLLVINWYSLRLTEFGIRTEYSTAGLESPTDVSPVVLSTQVLIQAEQPVSCHEMTNLT